MKYLKKMEKEEEKKNIALNCQRILRGRLGREEYQLKKWEKLNLSALKIQIKYRKWKMLQYTKKRNENKLLNININKLNNLNINKKIKNNLYLNSWNNVMNNKGNHNEKMFIWRQIIELRRGYRHSSTELCIKALIQGNGDVSKAITLLGSSEFSFQSHFGPPLEEDIKESLNPYRKTSTLRDEELEILLRQRPNSASMRRAHKHLQQSLITSAQLNREEYDLETILLQSYYVKSTEKQEKSKNKSKLTSSTSTSTALEKKNLIRQR